MNVMMPGSVPEALDMLASDGAAVPIAGGTDLLVHWPVRVEAHERTYVDLSRLDSLRPLRWTGPRRCARAPRRGRAKIGRAHV